MLAAYDTLKTAFRNSYDPDHHGVLAATVDVILKLVDASASPLRLLLGKIGYPTAKTVYEQRQAAWVTWNEVSTEAHGK